MTTREPGKIPVRASGELGQVVFEVTPEGVCIRSRLQSELFEKSRLKWVLALALLVAVVSPIAWGFGFTVGVCVTYPLGVLLVIAFELAAQLRGFRNLAVISPPSVLVRTGGDEPLLETERIPVYSKELRRIAVTVQDGPHDDDRYAVDVISDHLFIELTVFEHVESAQTLAQRLHTLVSEVCPHVELAHPPRHRKPLPSGPLVASLIIGVFVLIPTSLSPGLFPLLPFWLKGLSSALAMTVIGGALYGVGVGWTRRSLRRHLRRVYGIEPRR